MDELKPLVNEAKNGNKEAFKGIFERINKRLFSYVLSRTLNRDDTLDILQDTFIDLWNSLERFKYRTDEEFHGFVFTLAKRKLFHYYKEKNKTVPLDEKVINGSGESYEPPHSYMSGGGEIDKDDYRYLAKQVNSLSPNYQDVLWLRYWSGMTFDEIATFLNIKETTAKVWHFRAVQKLKTLLTNYESR